MKNTRSKIAKRPFILAVSAAALLAGFLPVRAALLLDPAGGTVLFDSTTSHDDEVSGGRSLGFSGTFFGTSVTEVDVSTNGNINFSGDATYSNTPFPTLTARIAPMWNDLYIYAGSGATITEMVAPGLFYAATWNRISDINNEAVRQTFQVVWFGGEKVIHGFTFKQDDIVFSYEPPVGEILDGTATVGIDSGDSIPRYVPLPGTTDGLITTATSYLLPAAAIGGFVLFRPDGEGSYTPYLSTPVLQNSQPVGTPVDANFIVVDDVVTGTQAEGNTIGSILFAEGASLRVYNTLNVTRNYYQTATGTLKLSLTNSSTFDRVVVGGVATLGGALEVSMADGATLKRSDSFAVVTAAGGISGTFSEVVSPFNPLLGLDALYLPNAVVLTPQQLSFVDAIKSMGGSPNQIATAHALDSVAFGTTVPQIIDYLDEHPFDLPNNLDKIAPEELASIFNIANSLSNVQMTNLENRLEDVRGGSTGFNGQRFALQGSLPNQQGGFGLAGPTGASGKTCKDCKVVAKPEEESRWGFFVNGAGEFVDIESTGNAKGFDFQSGGITLGVDYRVSENFAIGITAGYAHTGVDLTGQGSVGVDAGRLGIYATAFAKGFYVDAAVTGGYGAYDTRRSAIQGSAYGSSEAGELDVYVGTGYDFKLGALSIGPIVNFQYTYVDLDGFTEHGSLAPLKYQEQSNDSIRLTAGLKASYDCKVLGHLVRPSVRVAWQHEFGDTAPAVTAALGSGSSQFTVYGPNIGEDAVLVGAGFTVQVSERASAFLYYDGEFGRTNYQLNAISGGVRVDF